MSARAIHAVDIGKRYRRGLQLEPYKTAREAIVRMAKRPFRESKPKSDDRWFWALKDITFDLDEGEALGVIGRNGAGKTTLLKLLSQITKPTTGHANVRGRVGTLLEVGTSFHGELTGRENIYLNGAILGMTRREIRAKIDEIVEFAEVGAFTETPLKRYSSGMYMRLAFSVAAHMEPDILLVDEVLAVGDAAFQKKCLGKLGEVETEGRTVIFVSHNMATVRQICRRGMVLERGLITFDGPIDRAIETYRSGLAAGATQVRFEPDPARNASFVRLAACDEQGAPSSRFRNDEAIVIEAEFLVNRPLHGDHVWLALERADGVMAFEVPDTDGGSPVPDIREPGRYLIRFAVPPGLLNGGIYLFKAILGQGSRVQDERESESFEIEDVTLHPDSHLGRRGLIVLPIASEEHQLDAGAT